MFLLFCLKGKTLISRKKGDTEKTTDYTGTNKRRQDMMRGEEKKRN